MEDKKKLLSSGELYQRVEDLVLKLYFQKKITHSEATRLLWWWLYREGRAIGAYDLDEELNLIDPPIE